MIKWDKAYNHGPVFGMTSINGVYDNCNNRCVYLSVVVEQTQCLSHFLKVLDYVDLLLFQPVDPEKKSISYLAFSA